MRKGRLLGIVVVLVFAGLVCWRWTQHRPDAPLPTVAPTAPTRTADAPRPTPKKEGSSRPSRLTPDARREIIRALAAAQRRRMAAAARQENPHTTDTRRPAAPRDSETGQAPATDDPGTLDKEYIRERMREIVPLVKECYEETLRERPELEGKIVVQFTITGEPDVGGIIADSQVVEGTTIEDALFRECVQETMYALLMRAPDQGGEVIVTYPFAFHTAKP